MKLRGLGLTIVSTLLAIVILFGAIYSCMVIAENRSLLWLILAIPCCLILGLITIAMVNDSLKTTANALKKDNEVKE